MYPFKRALEGHLGISFKMNDMDQGTAKVPVVEYPVNCKGLRLQAQRTFQFQTVPAPAITVDMFRELTSDPTILTPGLGPGGVIRFP